MNKPFIAKASLLSLACFALLSSCSDSGYYYGSVGGGYSSSSYSGYGSGIYDSSGFPIFGYIGGRPVYGYNPYGSPIFSFTYIRSNCYVPYWGPAPHYHGRYHYPRGIHRVHNLPHYQHGWKTPHFDKGRPSIVNRPSFNPGNNHFITNPGSGNRPSFNPQRPSQRPEFNRPGNRPSGGINRPQWNGSHSGSRPSVNRPSQDIGNRPGFNSGVERPSGSVNRPQWNGGNSVNRPSINRPSREPGNRPGFNSGMERPSGGINRPQWNGSSSGQRPSFNRPSSGHDGGSRPSRPGRGEGRHSRGNNSAITPTGPVV